MTKRKTPGPPAGPEDFEQAAALLAALRALCLLPRWSRLVQKELLSKIAPEDLKNIGYDTQFKKIIGSVDMVFSLTIIWICTPGPECGPRTRALELAKLKTTRKGDKRLKDLNVSKMGRNWRELQKFKTFLKPQFTDEKYIAVERRHVQAGVKYGLVFTRDMRRDHSVCVYATETLHHLMIKFWKTDAALMKRLMRRTLDKKPAKKKGGGEEDTGGR